RMATEADQQLALLKLKLALHEQGTADPVADAHRISELSSQIAELVERGAGRLEAMEGCGRLAEALEDDPLGLSLAQLGVSLRTLNAFENYGVVWVRDLVQWTESMALVAWQIGRPALNEVRRK